MSGELVNEKESQPAPPAKRDTQTGFAQFQNDTQELSNLTAEFISTFYPSYAYTNGGAIDQPLENSLDLLNDFTFYKICECKIYDVKDPFEFFTQKIQKLFTVAYSINREVCYGLVSNHGSVSLVLGIGPTSPNETIPTIMEGLLPGVKLKKYAGKFSNEQENFNDKDIDKDRYVGCISGIPALKINGEYQYKDLSPLMRSLNGKNYTIMVMCKPVAPADIQNLIDVATTIKDKCFAISKRTLSYQNGISSASTHTDNYSEGHGSIEGSNKGINVNGGLPGSALGAGIGFLAGGPIGAAFGGLVGLIAGRNVSFNRSTVKSTSETITKGYSDAVTEQISKNSSISGEIQNSFALELMEMADSVITRLKTGRSIGMWKSVVSYSSHSELTSQIIRGFLYSEIASAVPEVLPPVIFEYVDSLKKEGLPPEKIHTQQLMIPKGFFENSSVSSPLNSLVTSEELCAICTIPTDYTVGFEIHCERPYALNYTLSSDSYELGHICEYDRPLKNIPFGLNDEDLNKHTLVCGITGCGKTNTVKKILMCVDKPFLVIEPAKKEYRNIIKDDVNVYTLGRPEINCLRLNPFYIPIGVSPQQHIDLLKDLFSASFAFYGPMPYILEKCLNNIYTKKGWNLALGFHPYLTDSPNLQDLFDAEKIKEFYSKLAHSYIFPTMQDLKDEIARYINCEMTYEGEVKGNIEGAMKARIDSLCVGAKGYMFNTNEFVDLQELLDHNTVLELEGLSDDADKAFALGLIIIYINEYRQVQKELDRSKGLKHLLVIEEAHRLLKNVSTENNEDLGNPKGKAVEHFTNLLAEMRSYGQGVIIAEQIPSKLAPEVIKNSSNKIVHRIVAQDDQVSIANSIGIYPDDAIYLGDSAPGYALCHKEGMVQPVIVKIDEVGSNNILDTKLYNQGLEDKMFKISKSIVQGNIARDIDAWAIRLLNSFMYLTDANVIYDELQNGCDELVYVLKKKGASLIPGVDTQNCILSCISDATISLLVAGIYSNHKLPEDDLAILVRETITKGPDNKRFESLKSALKSFYGKEAKQIAIEKVASLVAKNYAAGADINFLTSDFLVSKSSEFSNDVKSYLGGR